MRLYTQFQNTPPVLLKALLSICLLTTGCSTVNNGLLKSPVIDEAEKDHRDWVTQLNENKEYISKNLEGDYCWTRLQVNEDGIITNTNANLRRHGFRSGQVIELIEGNRYTESDLNVATKKFNDKTELSISVLDGKQSRTLMAPCHDGAKQTARHLSIMEHAINKRWSECIRETLQLENYRGYPSYFTRRHVYLCDGYEEWFAGRKNGAFDLDLQYPMLKALYNILSYDKYNTIDITFDQQRLINHAGYYRRTDIVNKATKEYDRAMAARLALSDNYVPSQSPAPRGSTSAVKKSQGTCFAIDKSGIVATNFHVVEGMSRYTATFGGGEPIALKLLKVSPANDLAILKAESKLEHVISLSPVEADLGSDVYTFGYPVADMFADSIKYTNGVISGDSGFNGEASFLQTTVATQPGNSGGPLVNQKGLVVGVTTSTAAVSNFMKVTSGHIPQNVNFAVKVDYLKALAKDHIFTSKVTQQSRNEVKNAVCILRASN